MRIAMALLLLAGCSPQPQKQAPPKPPDPKPTVNDWGENSAVVPSWPPPQDRRAPQIPKGWQLAEKMAPAEMNLSDGLLVCHGVLEKLSWDTFAGPDTLVRFRIGNQRAISFWGPEDSFDFYISIPRLTMAKGDEVVIDLWDRDENDSTEYMTTVKATFDGKFPWLLSGPHVSFECRAATVETARDWAEPWRKKVDRDLALIEQAQINREVENFGNPRSMLDEKDFRHYAAFLGWEHPDVQARLTRLTDGEKRWRGLAAAEYARIVAAAKSPDTWQKAGDWSARIRRDNASVVVELRGEPLPVCGQKYSYRPPSIDGAEAGFLQPDGTVTRSPLFALDDAGQATPCNGQPAKQVRLAIPAPPAANEIFVLPANPSLFWRLR
jgi:hypothetical protein